MVNHHPEYFIEAKEYGLMINVWTINDPNFMEEMIRQGAEFITTDKPIELKRRLDR
jgi:glycerophosphoryl diester phosphodiesterase